MVGVFMFKMFIYLFVCLVEENCVPAIVKWRHVLVSPILGGHMFTECSELAL